MSATSDLVMRPKMALRKVPPQMWRDTISRPQQAPNFGGLGHVRVRAFFAFSAHVSRNKRGRDHGNSRCISFKQQL